MSSSTLVISHGVCWHASASSAASTEAKLSMLVISSSRLVPMISRLVLPVPRPGSPIPQRLALFWMRLLNWTRCSNGSRCDSHEIFPSHLISLDWKGPELLG